jgi:hypothetical protein
MHAYKPEISKDEFWDRMRAITCALSKGDWPFPNKTCDKIRSNLKVRCCHPNFRNVSTKKFFLNRRFVAELTSAIHTQMRGQWSCTFSIYKLPATKSLTKELPTLVASIGFFLNDGEISKEILYMNYPDYGNYEASQFFTDQNGSDEPFCFIRHISHGILTGDI